MVQKIVHSSTFLLFIILVYRVVNKVIIIFRKTQKSQIQTVYMTMAKEKKDTAAL